MALDETTVRRIARLARLEVPEADIPHLAQDLDRIIHWVEQLNAIETDGVEPMTSVVDVSLPHRADAVTAGDEAEKVLANAPRRALDYFAVPKVVE